MEHRRIERGEAVAHRAGECAHGVYRVTVQLLLVRHALPLRSEPGQGSDPDLSEAGLEQARRLPEALARFPVSRLVSSPQRRAVQTAAPVADALAADGRNRRPDRGVRPRPSSTTSPSSRSPRRTPRSCRGWSTDSCPTASTRPRFWPGSTAAVDDLVADGGHEDTVAVFSHGGVINVLLHQILGTARILSFNVDYAAITRLLSSRTGRLAVAAVNGTEHVWDLLPRNQRW